MKRFFLFAALFLASLVSAQEYTSYLNRHDLTLITGDINKDVVLRVDQDESGFTTVYFDNKDGDTKVSFKIKPFSKELFEAKFRNSFVSLKREGMVGNELMLDTDNSQKITNLYSEIATYFYKVNERPQVANIYLRDHGENIPVYAQLKLNNGKTLTKRVGTLENPSVDMSFYAGFIEKIDVHGKVNGLNVTMANDFSIGVSSQSNIEKFYRENLVSIYQYTVLTEQGADSISYDVARLDRTEEYPEKKKDIKDEDLKKVKPKQMVWLFVYLDDIIDYKRIIDVNANDISPSKQRITLDQVQTSAKLYREESTKILEAVVFSDLIGALEAESPNGIVQTEVSRRFNLKTSRRQVPFLRSGFGGFEYINGKILLSKIEQDNKFLLPQDEMFDNLSLYQHRNFSIGGLLNIFTFENQNAKLNLFLETGLEFSRSGYQLTEEAEEENVNGIEWITQVKLHVFPEKRYGIILSDRISYYEILDDTTEFLEMLNTKNDWLNTIEFLAYLDVSTSSKLFVRYSLTHSLDRADNNFSRLQLGTAFFILEKNRKDN